jgi:hypothetical protein
MEIFRDPQSFKEGSMAEKSQESVQQERSTVERANPYGDREPPLGATVVEPPPAVSPPPRGDDGDEDL